MTAGVIARHNVRVTGNSDARQWIVFVHGFGTDQRAWMEVAAAFEADYRVLLLDNLGTGATRPEDFVQHRYLNLHAYAADVIAVCDAVGVQDAIIVGHSVGAMIALLAASAHAHLCSRLVLIGATPRFLAAPGYPGTFTEADVAAIYDAVAANYAEWADQFAGLMMGNPERPALARTLADALRAIPSKHALTVLYSIFQSDHRDDLAKVTQPTLIIQTREDLAVPLAVAGYLHEHIAQSTLSIIEAKGHLPHVSDAGAVIAAMRVFLSAPRGTTS